MEIRPRFPGKRPYSPTKKRVRLKSLPSLENMNTSSSQYSVTSPSPPPERPGGVRTAVGWGRGVDGLKRQKQRRSQPCAPFLLPTQSCRYIPTSLILHLMCLLPGAHFAPEGTSYIISGALYKMKTQAFVQNLSI